MSEDTHELSVTRLIDAPVETVWRVWTERTEDWFCPKPWTVEVIEQDFRPGGRSALVMRGPAGEEMPMEGVYLEVVPGKYLMTTDAFTAGWQPATPFMVGIWAIEPDGDGTRYTASARHWTQEACEQHRQMGFEPGWTAVAQQLKALCEGG